MELARRVGRIPPYLFVELDRLKAEKKAQGVDVIDLGVGDPDLPTPREIVDVAKKALEDVENHHYPSNRGLLSFRKSCAEYMKRRFGVSFNPETEVTALIGSKEGIAHFPLAFVNPGDVVLCPEPAYPVYHLGTILCDGEPFYLPLKWENDFLPDLASIPKEVLEKAKILWLNYPNNPTGGMATKEFFKEVVQFAKKHDIIVAHDAAYIEMYYEDPPISIFEVEGAKDVAIEFHSLSKTFCMTGWRIAFAVGNEFLISALAKIKSNVDSGVFNAVQVAGAYALDNLEKLVPPLLKTFKERRDFMADELKKLGYQFLEPKATFYLWVKTPGSLSSTEFCRKVIEECGIVVTPGSGFGKSGEGYFRIALTVGIERLKEAATRLESLKI